MKSFTSLSLLMLSAANVEAMTSAAELEHHHVSNQLRNRNRNRGHIDPRVNLTRNEQNDPVECNNSTECCH